MSNSRLVDEVRSRLPRPVKRMVRFAVSYPGVMARLWANYEYDARRFLRHSSADGRLESVGNLRAWIDADVHKLEKALALRSPRPGFGRPVVRRLLDNLGAYLDHGQGGQPLELALNTLAAYQDFNAGHGASDATLARDIEHFRRRVGDAAGGCGGVMEVSRSSIHSGAKVDFEAFLRSRHSIRQFSTAPVDPAMIERAVVLAQRTPSVCNRQAPRVHVFTDPVDRARVLACQRGNSGFGDQATAALVVTVELESFFSVAERNQAWIDGGMFAMSLVYALHSLGLGTCCLNWSVEKEWDAYLHQVAAIPESQVVIMEIAVGHLPERFTVAQSTRKPLDEVLIPGGPTRELAAPMED